MSAALTGLLQGLDEVTALQRANPTPTGAAPSRPAVTRAIDRASVVILSSHFERYIYAVNDEACDFISLNAVVGDALPLELRLLHAKPPVDDLAAVQWKGRSPHLTEFVVNESWLWVDGSTGGLRAARLLAWMTAPTPQAVRRYYGYWSIADVFSAVTRLPHNRSFLWLKLDELVTKRNNIAHGDFSEYATPADIRSYVRAVRTFCPRADQLLARQLSRLFGLPRPW